MSKQKLLFVIDSLECGGAEKSLVSLLSLLDYRRYDVHLLMFSPTGMYLSLLPEQVNILPELPYMRYCREGGRPKLRWCLSRVQTALWLRMQPKYHGSRLHSSQIYWKYVSPALAPLPGIYDAAIAWGQGNPVPYVAEKVQAKRKIAFINADYEAIGYNKWFDRPYYEACDWIAAVSAKLCDTIGGVYPDLRDRMRTIYDIRNQSLTEQMSMAFQPYTKEDGVPVLATVGRMAVQKGYDLAVGSGVLLKARGIPFRWYLIGDGPEYSRICTLIETSGLSDRMFAVGAKENPYPYVKHADVYVQTSRTEGYCLTLSEARGLHTPPVSTNFELVHEHIRNGENGLIVEMTPEAIADGIETMLRNDALRESIRQTLSRERVGNEEEIEKFYELLEADT